MDKEKAAKILTKELGDKVGRIFVTEGHYKELLLKNALAAYQIDNPTIISNDGYYFSGNNFNKETDIQGVIPNIRSYLEANYFFMESIPVASGKEYGIHSRFVITPYAIIGEKEKSTLRRMFYKNVPSEITNSMNTLGIEHFILMYQNYQAGEICYPIAGNVLEDVAALKSFCDSASKFVYDKDDEIKLDELVKFGGITSLNGILKRLSVNTKLKPHEVHTSYVHKNCISGVLNESPKVIERIKNQYYGSLSNEFINFVFFSIQREDQNVDFNKEILKNSLNLNFVIDALNLNFVIDVLSKEYIGNGPFCEYFDVLDKEVQNKIVNVVKVIPKKNPIYDSFLWSKGFKDLNLNHLELYKNDAKEFIEYFACKSLEEKKVILKDVMDCEFTNEGVIDWLNQNEQDLIREVGFNG